MPARGRARAAPRTFETFMDAGVDEEERGERFALGDKAMRHYLAAYAHYRDAARAQPTSVDAWYNAARVQHVLGTQFLLPPDAYDALLTALDLYAEALAQTDMPLPADVPSAARLDVLANAGHSLVALGELLGDCPLGDGHETHAHLESAARRWGAPVVQEAAVHAFTACADGQHAVLQGCFPGGVTGACREGGEDADTMRAPVDHGAPDTAAHVASPASPPAYTTSLVYPASYMSARDDQLSALADVMEDAKEPVLRAAYEAATNVIATTAAYAEGLAPGVGASHSPDGEWDAAVHALALTWRRARIAAAQRAAELAAWAWPSTHADEGALMQLCAEVLEEGRALRDRAPPPRSLTSVRLSDSDAHEDTLAALCDVADHAHTLACVLLRSAQHAERRALESLERVWTLATCAAQCLGAAAAAFEEPAKPTVRPVPDAPTAWMYVQDVGPIRGALNTSTPLSRRRAAIYLSLSELALTRSDPLFTAHWPPARDGAAKLLDNARVYARRALVDHGLAWVLHVGSCAAPEATHGTAQETVRAGGPSQPRTAPIDTPPRLLYARARAHRPGDGGSEALAREAYLLVTCMRAVWTRAAFLRETQRDTAGAALAQADAELGALAGGAWSLRQQRVPWQTALERAASATHAQPGNSAAHDASRLWTCGWAPTPCA
ncbi:hypothetical protein MSPP1_000849 [Malassezia sp. CBS 17886]|nr:hypothetical protein MSPP1_000849 [Malassezia sp. CBS 17886]